MTNQITEQARQVVVSTANQDEARDLNSRRASSLLGTVIELSDSPHQPYEPGKWPNVETVVEYGTPALDHVWTTHSSPAAACRPVTAALLSGTSPTGSGGAGFLSVPQVKPLPQAKPIQDSVGTDALDTHASGTQVDVAGEQGRLNQGTQGFEGDRNSHVSGRGNAVAMSQVAGTTRRIQTTHTPA